MRTLKPFNESELNFISKFIAVIHQGGGCDYTIECGTQMLPLESTNIDDANSELFDIISEEYTGERALESAVIYEVKSEHTFDLADVYEGKRRRFKRLKRGRD